MKPSIFWAAKMQTVNEPITIFQICEICRDFDFSSQYGKKNLEKRTSYFRTGFHFPEELQLSPDPNADKFLVSFRQTEAL